MGVLFESGPKFQTVSLLGLHWAERVTCRLILGFVGNVAKLVNHTTQSIIYRGGLAAHGGLEFRKSVADLNTSAN